MAAPIFHVINISHFFSARGLFSVVAVNVHFMHRPILDKIHWECAPKNSARAIAQKSHAKMHRINGSKHESLQHQLTSVFI